MGKSTISMVMFSSYVSHYQRVYPINIPLNHYKIPLNHYKSHSWAINIIVGGFNPPLLEHSNHALQVSSLAESEGHHPDLHLTNYRNVQAAMPKIFEIGWNSGVVHVSA